MDFGATDREFPTVLEKWAKKGKRKEGSIKVSERQTRGLTLSLQSCNWRGAISTWNARRKHGIISITDFPPRQPARGMELSGSAGDGRDSGGYSGYE